MTKPSLTPPQKTRWTWNLFEWRFWYWPGGTACLEPDEWAFQFGPFLIERKW